MKPGQKTTGRRRRWLGWGALLVTLTMAVAALGGWLILWASLPQLDGERQLPGLADEVLLSRDGQGVATLAGESRLDVMQGLGFLHAQERFFQMDLLRRSAAGELAALFGEAALGWDEWVRRHRLRQRSQHLLQSYSKMDQVLLTRYALGVNQGVEALAAAPFEYWLLGQRPQPWRPQDSLLVVYAMYLQLQEPDGEWEALRDHVQHRLGAEFSRWLMPAGTPWDAPLQGEPLPPPPLPPQSAVDWQQAPLLSSPQMGVRPPHPLWQAWRQEVALGSNSWVVMGRLTDHGGALLANDMHLGLRVPNVWYRAELRYLRSGRQQRLVGVTLPGIPAVVVGSNGHIAWGFTNSYGDWVDLMRLLPSAEANHYQTPAGPRSFESFEERIAVAGQEPRRVRYRSSHWGPLLAQQGEAPPIAARWVGHGERAINFKLLALAEATTAAEALTIAQEMALPAQNILVADRQGSIGWTLAGAIPVREGFDGQLPVTSVDSVAWARWLEGKAYPQILNPPSGRLWTANNRVVAEESLALIGDGGYDLGARARQIRDALLAQPRLDEAALLALQLDDRARFLARWRDLLHQQLAALGDAAEVAALRQLVQQAGECACVDDAGYRWVKRFRQQVQEIALSPIAARLATAPVDSPLGRMRQLEGALWQLVTEQPPHLLPPPYRDWSAVLAAATQELVSASQQSGRPPAAMTWGEDNRLQMQHPLSRALPGLGWLLDMPATPLPGDNDMPRVQSPYAGASMRLVVAPGREAEGILHLPGGQSGHPLSPFYRAGHQAWVEGEPTPLLPGETRHRLRLMVP